MAQKCGRVCIIGQPNAGKSTLTNAMVGAKVSIVSHKVQTTRVRTLGIAISGDTQFVLLDTPGIFDAKKTLENALVRGAWNSIQDADAIIVLVDASYPDLTPTINILEKLQAKPPVFLVLNKADKVSPQVLETLSHTFKQYDHIQGVLSISALEQTGIDKLIQALDEKMPFDAWHYPEDILTNQPENLWAAEITREQLYLQLHDELPYETYVTPEGFEYFQDGSIKISQAIVVSRSSQKGIILGAKGSRIKAIGQKARLELSKEMGQTVHLKLFVKVQRDWMEQNSTRKELGLE
ncbi:MAG: GTPase Era [Alphaproteobacteria bacterium]|nr:GTPase Era [Alphaproteobacteria bacterium]